MDRPSVHHGSSPKQAKSKKKPIKVVYISNPMKVRSTVTNFRALVQSLTGRGSDLTDIEKFLQMGGADELYRVPDLGANQATDAEPSPLRLVPTVDQERESSASTGSSSFEPVDDVFTQEMMEDFTGLLPLRPSSGFSFDHFFLRNLDV